VGYSIAGPTFRYHTDCELPEGVAVVRSTFDKLLQQSDRQGIACLHPQQKTLGEDDMLAIRLDRCRRYAADREPLQRSGRALLLDRTPMGRLDTALDIANGVLYLASDEASWVTGSELVIDGGMTAQ
jgi:NAD(P)-dependent dehydrogenase (short-subunit alcohol dehydrogenase family)